MKTKTWILLGSLAGLLAAIALDFVVSGNSLLLRLGQLSFVLLGAMVAGFVFEGAKAVTGGADPARSTDDPASATRPGERSGAD